MKRECVAEKYSGVKKFFPASDRSMIYAGLPVLNACKMDPDFNGKIIHVLEFGLGDTVNSIPIIKGTKKAFPKGRLVVYCEKRWLDIVRPYLSKEDELIGWDVSVQSYDCIFAQLNSSNVNGVLVPYMLRFPEQLAHGESKQEALVRGLNLNFFVPEIRPEMKISGQHQFSAGQSLLKEVLVKNEFAVLAPNAGRQSNKFWKRSSFEELALLIMGELGIKVVLLGQGGEVDLDVPGVVQFSDLNVFEAGWIISQSCIYVGLDSGLSHVSAVFDIPSLTLYPYISQDVIPFEVRVHSPFSSSIRSSSQFPEILPKDVLNCIRIFKGTDNLRPPAFCPACGRGMWYIDKTSSNRVLRRCVCGTSVTVIVGKHQTPSQQLLSSFRHKNEGTRDEFFLPESVPEMVPFIDALQGRDHFLISGMVTKEMGAGQEKAVLANGKEDWERLDFSMDGILFCLLVLGYAPQEITHYQISDQKQSLTIKFASLDSLSGFEKLATLWDGRRLVVPNWRWYFRYFSWEFWANEKFLDQLPKKVEEVDNSAIAFEVAWVVFRRHPSMKSFKYFVRYFFRGKIGL
ncbi:MAG: glycosyltransferase family 9 protein [Leptospirillum sp.]